MRLEPLALMLDAGMFLAWIVAVLAGNAWLAAAGAILLLALLALPVEPPGALAPKRTLAFVGVVLFGLVLGLATFALGETGPRFELSRDALPLLAVLAASAGIVGLVWASLWRAVATRPAPWKPAAFAVCLVLFLMPAAALAFSQASFENPSRLLLALSAAALAVAAALPFIDSVFRGRSRQGESAS